MSLNLSSEKKPNWICLTGLMGVFAALVTGIGEYYLLYAPELNHGAANNYANFLHPSEADLSRGFYLSAIGAPFYIFGYWHIVAMLRLCSKVLGGVITVSYTHLPSPRDATLSRMPSSA